MKLSIGDAAQRLGVSVRTLRHYDEIGLVKPTQVGENGYRYYDREAMALLQQVLPSVFQHSFCCATVPAVHWVLKIWLSARCRSFSTGTI